MEPSGKGAGSGERALRCSWGIIRSHVGCSISYYKATLPAEEQCLI